MGSGVLHSKSGEPSRRFAENLRCAMIGRELHTTTLSERSGVDLKRVRRLVGRFVHARLDEVEALSRTLRVPVEALAFEQPEVFAVRFRRDG